MRTNLGILLTVVSVLLLSACGTRGSVEPTAQTRAFPQMPTVPSVITEPEKAAEYVASNYWKAFLDTSKTYLCDSTHVLGVKNDDVELGIGTYLTILENNCSKDFGRQQMEALFRKVEDFEARDTSTNVFEYFKETLSRYLYDPNSPVRDEDLYLPYVKGLASSPYIEEGMEYAYEHYAQMCSLNMVGTKANDISFTDLKGRKHSLYGINADYTLLFFTNPGCPACREIIQQMEDSERISGMISSGELAVVNVYIDREIDKWKEYAREYPKEWYSGYDHGYQIRTEVTYNVRAIPSLYLLDSEKNVIFKDAPAEKVLPYLDNINNI